MGYTALYREWRPKTFTEVVGQKQVSETLMRAIRNDRISHAYLFSGPRGTGKTSMARIFARAINCEHGPTEHPCNECAACEHILENRSMDVVEMDAASNRGIEDVRKLRDSIQYLPVEGRKKIIIVDEAHMLTPDAWDALLKTIEEPPEHVIFIFATTEEGSFPDTILSRCQRFSFRRITVEDITKHLIYISQASNIKITPEAAQLIAAQADGGLRDALTSLEQCAGLTDDLITPQIVENFLGLAGKDWVISMTDKLQKGDGAGILIGIKDALALGVDIRNILASLVEHLRALLIAKVMPEADEIRVYDTHKAAFLEQSQAISVEEINIYVRALQNIQNDTRNEANPRIVIELGLLGICAHLKADQETLSNRVAALEKAERKNNESILNRLAEVENKAATMPVAMPGTFISRRKTESTAPMTEPVMVQTTDRTEENSVGGERPKKLSLPKLPPISSLTNTPTIESTKSSTIRKGSSPSLKSDLSSGEGVVLGESIRLPSEYKTVHSNVIKWLEKNNKGMSAGFYKMAELTYVDENRAVVVFNNNFNVMMASKGAAYEDAKEGFGKIVGYPIDLTVIASGTDEDSGYRAAAQEVMSGGAVTQVRSPQETVPSREVGTSVAEDEIPVQNFGAVPKISLAKEAEQQELSGEELRKLPKWDTKNIPDYAKDDELLVGTLAKLDENYDIYIECVDDQED